MEKVLNGIVGFFKAFWRHFRRMNTWQGFLIHVSLMFLITAIALYLVFNVWMPSTTNHGQSQLVPNLEGLSVQQAQTKLESEGLRMEVFDTVWSPRHKPQTIVSQTPKPQQSVKKNRMIYLTVNTKAPPKVKITEEVYTRVCRVPNAQAVYELRELGFRVRPTYEAKPNKGYVYDITVDGKSIKAGDEFIKNTMITLHIGRGTSSDKDERFYDTVEYDE